MQVFVEAERGSFVKGRYDERTLARIGERRASAAYPYAYGFVPGTAPGDDGDCADCYVVTKAPLREGRLVDCDPVGLLEMFEDDEEDHKLIARPRGEPWDSLPDGLRDELAAFIISIFSAYPDTRVRVGRLLPVAAAEAFLNRGAGSGG